jgi:glutamate N-acetyltransferase/amino-acid N-acetyltransferase
MINTTLLPIEGFVGNSIHSGIKFKNLDLSLIYSETPCIAAGAFTKNLTIAAPVIVTKEHLKNPIQALIVNSGNANAATGKQGLEDAKATCHLLAESLGIKAEQVLVSSTGVIGVQMPMDKIKSGIDKLDGTLSLENFSNIPKGMMTTDTFAKFGSVSFEIEGETIIINGMAKGSGMIHPNMATMLSFLTSNVNIDQGLMQKALSEVVDETFNMISVDGDTSTNDMVVILSNQKATHALIHSEGDAYAIFKKALYEIMEFLSIQIAKDGEGATKLLSVHLEGAKTVEDARTASKSIITSSLVKSAFFGEDANWGRILSSIGASGASLDPLKVDLSFSSNLGKITLMKSGEPVPFSEEEASIMLSANEIDILINLNDGSFSAKAWGCDLTYDYVKINADYRS